MTYSMVPEELSRKPWPTAFVAVALTLMPMSLVTASAAYAQVRPGDGSRPNPPVGDAPTPDAPQPDTPPPDASSPSPGGQPDQAPGSDADTRPWAAGVSASAQTRANELFEAGDALLREFQLTAAMVKYQEALNHWKHPAIHYRVASILISQGQQVQAYAETQEALRYGEAPLGKRFYDNATRIKEQLENTLVWLTVRCREDGAEVRLDGELLFNGPGENQRILMPGPHTVVATKAGMIPGTENVSLERGTRTTIELTLRIETAQETFYPTKGRWGGTVRALVDPQGFKPTEGQGMALLVGADYGVLDNVDIEFGAVLSGNPGIYAASVFFLRKGLWRPTVFLAVPVLWAGAVQPGARAGVGLEYTPTPWLAVTGQAGVEYYPRATERFVTTLFAPSLGIKIRR